MNTILICILYFVILIFISLPSPATYYCYIVLIFLNTHVISLTHSTRASSACCLRPAQGILPLLRPLQEAHTANQAQETLHYYY